MNCPDAQERILESLAGPQTAARAADLDRHIAGCDTCRHFFEVHRQLDLQLSLAISAPSLSPRFRQSLIENLPPQPYDLWPEFLPDAAHFAGGICATALSIWTLPFPAGSVILAGLAFTLLTYFVQSVVRNSLESLEEGR